MKKSILICAVYSLLCGNILFAQQGVLRPIRVSVRRYIPIKPEFRQLRLSNLPREQGKLDVLRIVIDTAYVSKDAISNLDRAQRKELREIIVLMERGNDSLSVAKWKEFLSTFRNKTTPVDLDEIIRYMVREAHLTKYSSVLYKSSKVRFLEVQSEQLTEYVESLRRQLADCEKSSSCPDSTKNEIKTGLAAALRELQRVNRTFNQEFLALQNQMQMESRQFNSVSNALKARHDAATASIRNIK